MIARSSLTAEAVMGMPKPRARLQSIDLGADWVLVVLSCDGRIVKATRRKEEP